MDTDLERPESRNLLVAIFSTPLPIFQGTLGHPESEAGKQVSEEKDC